MWQLYLVGEHGGKEAVWAGVLTAMSGAAVVLGPARRSGWRKRLIPDRSLYGGTLEMGLWSLVGPVYNEPWCPAGAPEKRR